MSELARRRRARDLWISRGHVGAATAIAALVAVIAFSAGVLVGKVRHDETGDRRLVAGRIDAVPDDSLVTLLARVEATAHPSGGTEALTFPDALYAEGGPEVALPEERPLPETSAVPGAADVAVSFGAQPGFTVEIGAYADRAEATARAERSIAASLDAWVVTERVGDETRYRVGIGHHATEAAATEWLDAHRDELPEGAAVVKLP